MPRDEVPFAEQLTAAGEGAPSLEHKAQLLRVIRGHSPEQARKADIFLLGRVASYRSALTEARADLEEARHVLEKLTATPWHPAVFLGLETTALGPRARVTHGSTARLVGLADDMDPDSVEPGDEVFLGNELNVIMAVSSDSVPLCGETAGFDRLTPDGRMVLKWRDEEVVVRVAGRLACDKLKPGDPVRWDRSCWMAFERIEKSRDGGFFLEETPSVSFDDIGGLDGQIRVLKQTIELHLFHRDVVKKYRQKPVRGVLLSGLPGNGKTMLASALACWTGGLSKSGRSRFMNVKPGAMRSMWYGQSEAMCRELFRVARRAAEEDPDVPVVMFFDEIDSTGATRGETLMRVDDRVLQAFQAELDGLEERGNVLVVAATNRRDVVDPALLRPGRLGDLTVEVPRPSLRSAREIFAKHLPADIPYAGNGQSGDGSAVREEIIDTTVSKIFSPNGLSELCTVLFRDGQRTAVRPPDLISGAVIASIARNATRRASLRETETGESGVRADDLLTATSERFEWAASVLTPRNCRGYLPELRQDADVVAVEPVLRRVRQPHRYLDLSVA